MHRDNDEYGARFDGAQKSADGMLQPSDPSDPSQLSQLSQPVPLIRPLPAAAPFPIDALGPILAPAAKAVMEYVQVPDALAAHSVLASAALAAQSLANVQTLGGVRPLSLYMLTLAESGERKTAADMLTGSVMHERRMILETQYKAALREHEAAHEGHKKRVKDAKQDAGSSDELVQTLLEIQEEAPPRKPWFLASEPTAEGLFISLEEGQLSQALTTDEGGQFLGGHAMSEEAELRTITMLSRLWDGSPIDRVRATNKEHTTLYGRRLSVHLLAQPAVAARLLGSALYKSQGILARFLICAPASRIGTRLHDGNAADARDDSRLRRYWHAIRQLFEQAPNEEHQVGGLDPPCLALSPEARTLLVAAYNEIEIAQCDRGDLCTIREFASKAAEHTCRIAAVLTLAEKPDSFCISDDTMRRALEIVQFYLHEHVRLAGFAAVSIEIDHAEKLREWLKQSKRLHVRARDVMRFGPYAIREGPDAKRALRVLVEHGWLVTEDHKVYTVPSYLRDELDA